MDWRQELLWSLRTSPPGSASSCHLLRHHSSRSPPIRAPMALLDQQGLPASPAEPPSFSPEDVVAVALSRPIDGPRGTLSDWICRARSRRTCIWTSYILDLRLGNLGGWFLVQVLRVPLLPLIESALPHWRGEQQSGVPPFVLPLIRPASAFFSINAVVPASTNTGFPLARHQSLPCW